MTAPAFEIFATAPPGLEPVLLQEISDAGFQEPAVTAGGVTFQGGWPEVWRANLELRGAGRVLARIGGFMAFHLAQLDKRSRKFPFADVLRPDVPVRVDVTTRKSKIYHAGAATQRIETALRETHGIEVHADAALTLKARIDDNAVTFSIDTSGESLHKRGHKEAVGKAPMRETLAALMLRRCGYNGEEPVLDPMCGSGTFVLEAADIGLGLMPGRSRAFAFEQLASFDAEAWANLRSSAMRKQLAIRHYGFDRDQGAVRMATANAERAGVEDVARFECRAVADLVPPDGPPGLVMINPPYGTRISNKKPLFGLHANLGERLSAFHGWRVGLVTSEPSLANATKLPFGPKGPAIPHGGLKVWLFQTGPLP